MQSASTISARLFAVPRLSDCLFYSPSLSVLLAHSCTEFYPLQNGFAQGCKLLCSLWPRDVCKQSQTNQEVAMYIDMHTQTIPAALLTPQIACVIPATAEVLRFGGFESLSKQL